MNKSGTVVPVPAMLDAGDDWAVMTMLPGQPLGDAPEAIRDAGRRRRWLEGVAQRDVHRDRQRLEVGGTEEQRHLELTEGHDEGKDRPGDDARRDAKPFPIIIGR